MVMANIVLSERNFLYFTLDNFCHFDRQDYETIWQYQERDEVERGCHSQLSDCD